MFKLNGEMYKSNEYDNSWIWEFEKMMAYTTPEKREKIMSRVNAYVEREDSRYTISGYCDRSKAVELGDVVHGWGPCYLYVWLDKNGIPFYVGKSDGGDRMAEYKYNTRSSEFQAKISEGGCHSVMVVKHVSPYYIDEMEKWLISYLCWKGYPLVNKKDVPSREKLAVWSLCEKHRNVRDVDKELGEELSDLFVEWRDAMRKYTPIIIMLDEVIGSKWTGECAEFKKAV